MIIPSLNFVIGLLMCALVFASASELGKWEKTQVEMNQ